MTSPFDGAVDVPHRSSQMHRFLADGLLSQTTPTLLLVGTSDDAAELARHLHAGYLPEFVAGAAPTAGLRSINGGAPSSWTRAGAEAFFRDLRVSGHWLVVEEFERLLGSAGGDAFVELLCAAIAAAELPFIAAVVSPENVERIQSEALRFAGLARTLPVSAGSAHVEAGELVYAIGTASDPSDVGWLAIARIVLTAPPVAQPGLVQDEDRSVMRLVQSVQLIDDHGRSGILIGFHDGAFTASQQAAVFAAGEAAARVIIGRPLGPNERVETRRAIFYV